MLEGEEHFQMKVKACGGFRTSDLKYSIDWYSTVDNGTLVITMLLNLLVIISFV